MEQRQQKSTLVLKYAKRRFDGGNEAELIRVIERQQDIAQLNKLYQNPESTDGLNFNFPSPFNLAPQPVAPQQEAPKKAVHPVRSKVWETILRGPLHICIGVVGVLTASLAIVTFRRQGNDLMVEQSRMVFNECVKSLRKGCWDTLTTPVRVVKVLFSKA
jgi:hypothetical protein